MKTIMYVLLLILLMGCERYEQPSCPEIFMGGGKFTLIDYDIVIVSAISPATIIKNDTVCINSFSNQSVVNGAILMSQNYKETAISRRFIKHKTQWEFDGMFLYCEWDFPGGRPSHEGFMVNYPIGYLSKNYTMMEITEYGTGVKTNYTFKTNNIGVAPPSELILTSPEIVTDLYFSNGEREKAVTVRVILTFMR